MKSITHVNSGINKTDRAWQVCKCSVCGIERECTPDFDFYTREEDRDLESAPLYCLVCLIKEAKLDHTDSICITIDNIEV